MVYPNHPTQLAKTRNPHPNTASTIFRTWDDDFFGGWRSRDRSKSIGSRAGDFDMQESLSGVYFQDFRVITRRRQFPPSRQNRVESQVKADYYTGNPCH